MKALVKGGIRPSGVIRVSGAKNSATRLLAAAMLTDDDVVLSNFPTELVDVKHKLAFATRTGAAFSVNEEEESLVISGRGISNGPNERAHYDVPIRTTYLLAATQLLRTGIARIPYPGGCPIGGGSGGGRGYDLHILVWEALGCSVTEREDHIEVRSAQGLQGGDVDFPKSTVGGTENALLCASIASGTTRIRNAYITPEVRDLISLLRKMGSDIDLVGASTIHVRGRGQALDGASFSVLPDRIEALTWLVFAAMSGGDIEIRGVPFECMDIPLHHLNYAGIDFYRNSNSILVNPNCLTYGAPQPFELACGAHPGIISDMQSFFVVLAACAEGTSRIYDYRYPERIAFVDELAKLTSSGKFEARRGEIAVHGRMKFSAGTANATDLRGGMVLLMAALCAHGQSIITNFQMPLRGYNRLIEKLASLGLEVNILADAE